jgi:hypothetical protein
MSAAARIGYWRSSVTTRGLLCVANGLVAALIWAVCVGKHRQVVSLVTDMPAGGRRLEGAGHQQSFRPLRPGPYGPAADRVGLVSAVPARPDPHAPHEPSPQPANRAGLPALLAVPEPAQPARLGVAIKQPPPVRLITTLGWRRVSVAVRHSILPAADGRRRPPAWRLGAPGGRRIRATDRHQGIEQRRAPANVLPPPSWPVNIRLSPP